MKGINIGSAGNRIIAAAETHINSNEPFIIARFFFIFVAFILIYLKLGLVIYS